MAAVCTKKINKKSLLDLKGESDNNCLWMKTKVYLNT